jgi:hypothetical protein
MVTREKIINFEGAEGKRLSELTTLWGEPLVDFEHYFLTYFHPGMEGRTVDISDWLAKIGRKPGLYYERVMAFSIAHFVYLEDFDLSGEESFTRDIVIPAFKNLKQKYGVQPLIVKISTPQDYIADPFWWCYSKRAKAVVDARRHMRI